MKEETNCSNGLTGKNVEFYAPFPQSLKITRSGWVKGKLNKLCGCHNSFTFLSSFWEFCSRTKKVGSLVNQKSSDDGENNISMIETKIERERDRGTKWEEIKSWGEIT